VNENSAWPLIIVIGLVLLLVFSGGGIVIDPPNPPPITEPGFRVVIVEETSERDKLTEGQRDVLLSTRAGSVRDYCVQHCVKVNGQPEFRVLDKDTPTEFETPGIKAAMARPRTSVPWLVCSNGRTGAEGPLPATEEETLKILKKYGE
jgi:hypothetical protein